jgi:hypothetical protein
VEEKIHELHINKIIQEYSYLKSDEEFKKEVISTKQSEFLKIINQTLQTFSPDQLRKHDDTQPPPVVDKKTGIDIDEIPHNTKIKAKNVYRDIVKLTHPDKVDDNELNELYIEAKEAYEVYDLFELYFIARSLNIRLKLTFEEMDTLNKLIDLKKQNIKSIESSYVWLWINGSSEDEKIRIVNPFIEQHYLI